MRWAAIGQNIEHYEQRKNTAEVATFYYVELVQKYR